MTPREKAKELVEKYSFVEIAYHTSMFEVKQCALIAVEEILNCPAMNDCEQVKYSDGSYAREYYEVPNKYWTKVKHEIEKL